MEAEGELGAQADVSGVVLVGEGATVAVLGVYVSTVLDHAVGG